METLEVIPRRWGNSLGVAIPKEVVEKEGVVPGKPLIISVNARPDFESVFGTVDFGKSAQKVKDEMKEGW